MIALQNYEKCFLFHLKSSFRCQDIQIFVIFSFPCFPDSNGQMEVELFLMSSIGSHKFAGVLFEITQKQLYITPSNLVR